MSLEVLSEAAAASLLRWLVPTAQALFGCLPEKEQQRLLNCAAWRATRFTGDMSLWLFRGLLGAPSSKRPQCAESALDVNTHEPLSDKALRRSRKPCGAGLTDLPQELVEVILELTWGAPVAAAGCSSAKAELRRWASYSLVCQQWRDFFAAKSLALDFGAPMTDRQLGWLTSTPIQVHRITWAEQEQRSQAVLASTHFRRRSGQTLTALSNLQLHSALAPSGAPASTHPMVTRNPFSSSSSAASCFQLAGYSALASVEAAGPLPQWSGAELALKGLPPALASLQVRHLKSCHLKGADLEHRLEHLCVAASDCLQLQAEFLMRARCLHLSARDIIFVLPTADANLHSRVDALVTIMREGGLQELVLECSEFMLLDFVISQFPIVMFVVLQGGGLLRHLAENYAHEFDCIKEDGKITIRRK